ncbi:MAG: FliI/YscN family ATPase [Planctomycetota bacterium]
MTSLGHAMAALDKLLPMHVEGRVATLRGATLLAEGLPLPVGTVVRVHPTLSGGQPQEGEIIGFAGDETIVMLMGRPEGIRPGDPICAAHAGASIGAGEGLLGRVIDAMGRAFDDRPDPAEAAMAPLDAARIGPLVREPIATPLRTGVRAIDLVTPIGRGQRMGIFAGPGVGKSTLLGQITRHSDAQIIVVALIGERGREVREFVEDSLGEEGLARSVVVCATADDSPLMRARAARSACAIAEHFRDEGCDVLLVMDSLTRYAHALRQIGLAAGEPPTSRGYTPSVFAALAQLLERAGAVGLPDGRVGSITGLYTVLVEGDDFNEPISDAVRGILDGHLELSRELANRGHFPAIDVLGSVSRLATKLMDPTHAASRMQVQRVLAARREAEDLIRIGAYTRGSSREVDAALELEPRLDALLRQPPDAAEPFDSALEQFVRLGVDIGQLLAAERRG